MSAPDVESVSQALHRRACDLADELDAFAEGCPWATTASLARQAASSMRWQVRWEERHPKHVTPACPWCGCVGFHSEVCEGFEVNDPAGVSDV